jgi:hypothetical protein
MLSFISTREMIEGTTILGKEIVEMYEGERKRLHRSASLSAVLDKSRQEFTPGPSG